MTAALHLDKQWFGDGPLFYLYGSSDGKVMLGQVTRTADGWNAFDLEKLNAAQTGPLCIGHYQDETQAKKAVEDHWMVAG